MRYVKRLLTFQLGRKPLGIWVAWLGLVYAAAAFSGKLFALAQITNLSLRLIEEYVVTWVVIVAAIVALARRRLIARMFGGMAMTLLFFHCLFHADNFGMIAALITIPCLIANRRWYDEKMPKGGW